MRAGPGPGDSLPPLDRGAVYTPEQRARRDASVWTTVQGVLAPLQFAVFGVSVTLVLRWLATGEDYGLAAASVVLKTLLLYAIMITGSIWEKAVFGRYLFAGPFFWEDVVSMAVLVLHTAYLVLWADGTTAPRTTMLLALAAYAAYAINAAQFLLKFRMARRQAAVPAALAGRPRALAPRRPAPRGVQ